MASVPLCVFSAAAAGILGFVRARRHARHDPSHPDDPALAVLSARGRRSATPMLSYLDQFLGALSDQFDPCDNPAGTVILACTVVLWFPLTFPLVDPADVPAGMSPDTYALEQSYAANMGKALEPVIEPLGYDWKIGVGLIGSFAAREVFVATMGVVYGVGADVDEDSDSLRARIRESRRPDGTLVYTPLVGLSLMVFFAFAAQCMSTLAAVKRETGGYKWPVFMVVYMTALAWVASFAVYQGGLLLGFG